MINQTSELNQRDTTAQASYFKLLHNTNAVLIAVFRGRREKLPLKTGQVQLLRILSSDPKMQ